MSFNQSQLTLGSPYKLSSSSSKKLSQTDDCPTTKTKLSQLPILDISMFSTTYSLKRINQIQPKPKLIIPSKTTSTLSTSHIQTPNSHIQTPNSQSKQSIKYSEIKSPLFSWKSYIPICGFEPKTGENGCLCSNPCPFVKKWTANYKEGDFKLYQQLLSEEVKKEQEIQIDKDILRTHPQCLTFSNNPRFQQMLKQVLSQYTIYDPQVGYVQGMNLIVGTILYHIKNAQLTFWAFVDLMDEQQLRMIYLPGFQQLHIHQAKIIQLIDTQVNDLMKKMVLFQLTQDQLNIIPQSFLNGWILSLMAICIPLEYMHLLIQKFRTNGWNFIYQLIITYLLFLKESLLRTDEESEFLMTLTTKNSMEYGRIWEELIQNASNFPLESKESTDLSVKY